MRLTTKIIKCYEVTLTLEVVVSNVSAGYIPGESNFIYSFVHTDRKGNLY